MKSNKKSLQDQQQEEAIKLAQELLAKLKRHELLAEECGWWQAGHSDRFTFRFTVNSNNN